MRLLYRYRGLMSVRLQIEHSLDPVPDLIVFWASLLPWTAGFNRLKAQLESLGYEVAV